MFNTILDENHLLPAFKTNNNLIILSSDNNYSLYLGVCIQSIIYNANSKINYDIIVLEDNITDNNKKLITELAQDKNNISIRFFNMQIFSDKYKTIFFTRAQFSIATYYRFFIPEIFSKYNRALYLDCDLVICKDISPLFETKFDNYCIIATPDIQVINDCVQKQPVDGWNLPFNTYLHNILDIKNINEYFQAGMMILNITKLKTMKMSLKCIEKLKEIRHPVYVDQDILNSVFYKQVKFTDLKWNYMYHIQKTDYLVGNIPSNLYDQYIKAKNEIPCILHLTGRQKPWNNPNQIFAEYFWKYARQTPFYEKIIYQNLKKEIPYNANNAIDLTLVRETANYLKNKITYWRYRLLSKITFGKKRRKYKQKRKELKTRLKQVRAFLKGK